MVPLLAVGRPADQLILWVLELGQLDTPDQQSDRIVGRKCHRCEQQEEEKDADGLAHLHIAMAAMGGMGSREVRGEPGWRRRRR